MINFFKHVTFFYILLGIYYVCCAQSIAGLSIRQAAFFVDSTNSMSFEQVQDKIENWYSFKDTTRNAQKASPGYTYWMRFKIEGDFEKHIMLHSFAFHYDVFTVYMPTSKGDYQAYSSGFLDIGDALYWSTFYPFIATKASNTNYVYVKTYNKYVSYTQGIGIDYSVNRFIMLSDSKLWFGIIMGVLLFSLVFTIILYALTYQVAYLFFLGYICSLAGFILFLENTPAALGLQIHLRMWLYTLFFVPVNVFLLLYIIFIINLKKHQIYLFYILLSFIIIRLIFFSINNLWLNNQTDWPLYDLIVMAFTLMCTLYIHSKYEKVSIYILLGLAFMVIGFCFHLFPIFDWLGVDRSSRFYFRFANFGVFEVFFFTFSILDNYKTIKDKNENMLNEIIDMKQHNELRLEKLVQERTQEIKEQRDKINMLNQLLLKENEKLALDLASKEKSLIEHKVMSFDEFCQIYPTEEACHQFLSDIKWSSGFKCLKCCNTKYTFIKNKFTRRCTRCAYIESDMYGTIFTKIRFPLQKAFYIAYFVHTGKKMTIDALSESLQLRRQTTAEFVKRVKSAIQDRIKRKVPTESWTELI